MAQLVTTSHRMHVIDDICVMMMMMMMQITFELTVKQLMSFDPGEWSERLRKEYILVIEGFFSLPIPLFSTTYRKAIKVFFIKLIYLLLFFV